MKKTLSLIVGMTIVFVRIATAQEHPEHPAKKKEHPEHPAKAEQAKSPRGYTMDQVATAITAEIKKAEKKNGGVYKMKDKNTKRTWTMKLDRVHRERLSRLDAKTYFACTDFKSRDGHTVDVDFFMKDNGKRLVMTEATIHKVDGKPRYNWQEKDGFWVRVPIAK